MTDVQLIVCVCLTLVPILILFIKIEVDELYSRLESSTARMIQGFERFTTVIEREMREANRLRSLLEADVSDLRRRLQK